MKKENKIQHLDVSLCCHQAGKRERDHPGYETNCYHQGKTRPHGLPKGVKNERLGLRDCLRESRDKKLSFKDCLRGSR